LKPRPSLEPLGWKAAWFSEIEAFPSAVLAERWPEVINLGDMTKIAAAVRTGEVQAPDVMVGGTPCQAFSIAGLRNGLADARGQLTLSYVELANAIDDKRIERGKKKQSSSGKTSPESSQATTTLLVAFWQDLPEKAVNLSHQGKVDARRLCVWTPKDNRLDRQGRPIFRSGPTTQACVRCRKCSKRIRSPPGTF
jgi:DNA (cytosine-5)-methyltransferase 1